MSVSGSAHTGSTLSAQIGASALTRTLSGIVRSELPTIEAALQHGLRYEQLCQHLAALGVTVTPGTLRQTVYRLRRQNSRRARDSGPTSRQPALEEANGPRNSPAITSGTALAPKVPLTPEPPLVLSTPSDTVPLLANSAEASDEAVRLGPPPDFITAIRRSSPDLDVLAHRYRKSQQREPGGSSAAKATSLDAASAADLTSRSSSPWSTSS